ncbi:baseplate J/gp47 family protein [Streptomyces sp. NPDC012421]|uniref:baseplate J/gp47 family protein n=1 Tax=Streptomyces sp. NPDC012421 TaxID=3364832 RepID=UPI0036E99F6F
MTPACACRGACGCDPLEPVGPRVHNPPRRPALDWRVAPHAHALGRMRAALASSGTPAAEDPAAVAFLDAWAYVTDVVSFYTERIANEGFLRTAVEPGSVRELARTLGHEPRPGVAASADLAFTVDDTPGAPAVAHVPAGTPVQSVPAAGQLPQTFETSDALLARACWNAIPLAPSTAWTPKTGDDRLWVPGTGTGVRPGGGVLVVGRERLVCPRDERWDFRVVEAVEEDPEGHVGWTRLRVSPALGDEHTAVAEREVEIFAFDERAEVFGWNAPDPALLRRADGTLPDGADTCDDGRPCWKEFGIRAPGSSPTTPRDAESAPASGRTDAEGEADPRILVELDGDRPRLTARATVTSVGEASWVVLEDHALRELYRVRRVDGGAASRYAISGRITRLRLDGDECLDSFGRRTTLVHCVSRRLESGRAPHTEAVHGRVLQLALTDPLLPEGRTVVVTGHPDGTAPTGTAALTAGAEPPPVRERAVVVSCAVAETPDGVAPTMTVTLDRDLPVPLDPRSLRVLANVVPATHGETVTEVLGSGDGRVPFPAFRPRRVPLTYVRATGPSGARPALELRVDGVVWPQVPSLHTAAPADRVHVLRGEEDGGVRLTLGDGAHGARPSTGVENVTATYRVGIGAEGAVAAGQLSLLPRRPLGIRSVVNPSDARDWAPPESPDDARLNAPQRVRTFDRAVSVADHEDFAAGYAGVARARADGVPDATGTTVVVTVLGTGGAAPSDGLLGDLRTALEAARHPGSRLEVLAGRVLWFGIEVGLRHDPAYDRLAVERAVEAALTTAYSPAVRPFAEPVTAASVLVAVRRTPGVLACTMPSLWAVRHHRRPVGVLTARPARPRSKGAGVMPAQLLALAPGALTIGVMP